MKLENIEKAYINKQELDALYKLCNASEISICGNGVTVTYERFDNKDVRYRIIEVLR